MFRIHDMLNSDVVNSLALLEKVWTRRAEGSTVVTAELMVSNESVYLDDSEIITDWIGQPEPLTGDLQARNMEFDRDSSGHFRSLA